MSTNATQPAQFPTVDAVTARLREAFPDGGSASFRLASDNDDDYLYIEDLSINDDTVDPDHEKMPEDVLGQDLYEALDSAVNTAMAHGSLTNYEAQDKFYEINW